MHEKNPLEKITSLSGCIILIQHDKINSFCEPSPRDVRKDRALRLSLLIIMFIYFNKNLKDYSMSKLIKEKNI